MKSFAFLLALLAQVARISVPYLLAALGGTASERSGVINIALEGILLVGAFGATVGSLAGNSAALGLLCGVGAGLALAALYGLAVIQWRANQIVCGVAATLLALGATRYFLMLFYHSSSNSPRLETAGLGIPLMIGTGCLVAVAHYGLFYTRFGLRLRAVGEHPEAAETVGVAPLALRWAGVLLSGALAGLGGVWLAFDQHGFVGNMSAGRGFIALAAMILGRWRPTGALFACLLFGACETLQLRLQGHLGLAAGTVQSIPYLVTILALTLRSQKSSAAPKALGLPY
jgi:simple sugar transport system permease protein